MAWKFFSWKPNGRGEGGGRSLGLFYCEYYKLHSSFGHSQSLFLKLGVAVKIKNVSGAPFYVVPKQFKGLMNRPKGV